MSDLISRQGAIDAMFALCDEGGTLADNKLRDNPHIDGIIDVLENLPSAQQKGEWKWQLLPSTKILLYCSECGWTIHLADNRFYNFCPNCGADMRGGTK